MKYLQKHTPLALIIVLSNLMSCHQKKTFNTSVITISDSLALKQIKEVFWPKAYREQDTVLLDKILDNSFQLIDGDGNRFRKTDELNWIKSNAMVHDSFRYEIKRLDIYRNGTAVVAGTGHIYNDSTYSIYQSSNVLIKRDSLWKAILSHVSGFKKIK